MLRLWYLDYEVAKKSKFYLYPLHFSFNFRFLVIFPSLDLCFLPVEPT